MFSSLEKVINAKGGPTLLLTDMDVADATPKFSMDLATYLVYAILEERPSTENCSSILFP